MDAEKAVFEVANCLNAIRQFASSSVRTSCGKMNLQELLDNRAIVSSKVVQDLSEDLLTWGFTINKFEITEMAPRNRQVKSALNNQITAEQEAKETRIKADS